MRLLYPSCLIHSCYASASGSLFIFTIVLFPGCTFSNLVPAGFSAHESAGPTKSGCSQSAHDVILARSGHTKTRSERKTLRLSTICAPTRWRHHRRCCVKFSECLNVQPVGTSHFQIKLLITFVSEKRMLFRADCV